MTMFRRFPDPNRWSPALIIMPRQVPVYEKGRYVRDTTAVLTWGWRKLSSDVLRIGDMSFRRYEYCMGDCPRS